MKAGYTLSGQGTPVVLLHSSLSSKAQWEPLQKQISDRHQVVAIDLWGYGETPAPESLDTFRLSHEVALVERSVNDLVGHETPFLLAGHSYGGAVALRYAWEHPQRVDALAVFEPVAFHLLRQRDQALTAFLQIGARLLAAEKSGASPDAEISEFIDFWNGPGTFSSLPPRLKKSFLAGAPKLARDFIALTEDSADVEDYSQLTLPVLLMAGRHSPDAGLQVIRALEACLPNAVLQNFDGGHMAPVNRPEMINSSIVNFFQSQTE